jgi:hypothetical protein
MPLTNEHRTVNTMILQGRSFDQIEDYINALGLPTVHLSALWLLAWSEATDAKTRRRMIADTLSDLGSEPGDSDTGPPDPPATRRKLSRWLSAGVRGWLPQPRGWLHQRL